MNVLPVQFIRGIGERASSPDRADYLQRLSPIRHYRSPFFKRPAIWSAVRDASAMIVCVGFFSDAKGKHCHRRQTSSAHHVSGKSHSPRMFSNPTPCALRRVRDSSAARHRLPGSPRRSSPECPSTIAACHGRSPCHCRSNRRDGRARQPPIILLCWIQIYISLRVRRLFAVWRKRQKRRIAFLHCLLISFSKPRNLPCPSNAPAILIIKCTPKNSANTPAFSCA